MGRVHWIATVACLAGACSPGAGADGGGPDAAATTVGCGAEEPVEIGRCRREDGGECNGCEVGGAFDGAAVCGSDVGAQAQFVPFANGDPVAVALGPQGSPMIVFGMRASGIEPGSARVEFSIVNLDTGRLVSSWSSPDEVFAPDAEVPGAATAPLLFVLLDAQMPNELVGDAIEATGRMRQGSGGARCGSVRLEVDRYITR